MRNFGLYHQRLKTEHFHPHVVAYYYKRWNGFYMPFHAHEAVEIMYVISGECKVEMKDHCFFMKKGHFILIDAGVSHRLIVDKDCSCRMLNVEFLFREKHVNFLSLKDLSSTDKALKAMLELHQPYILLRDASDVQPTLKSLVLELDDQCHENDLMIHLLLSQILIRIARLIEETSQRIPQQADFYVKKAVEYIHHHYDCNLRVRDIASSVHLHPSYLHRIFKETMGRSLMEYLTHLRIEKAKRLLTQTDIPVTEVSDYIGISTCQYFSAIFKKHTGKTPLEFRNSVQKLKQNSDFND